MPNSPPHGEILEKRSHQARFLDLDRDVKEHEFGLKFMIPDPEVFAGFYGEYYGSPPHVQFPRLIQFVTPQNVPGSRNHPRHPVIPDPTCGTDIRTYSVSPSNAKPAFRDSLAVTHMVL